MPRPAVIAKLFFITPNVTQTTAHIRYTTQELSNKYQTPVQHLSVFIDPGQYRKVPYKDKENLIIYSTDRNPYREKVVETLSGSLNGYKVQGIRNLSYDAYKEIAAKAKFCLTFGEGFDGYFIESFFSGGIGLAVYNNDFFPDKSFMNLPSVFSSYDSLAKNLVKTINSLDNEQAFNEVVDEGYRKIGEIYSYDKYLSKMESFYKKNFDFLPQQNSESELLKDLFESFDEKDQTRKQQLENVESQLAEERDKNKHLKSEIKNLHNSRSWKITGPLRKVTAYLRLKD
jgi:hypothetical protein